MYVCVWKTEYEGKGFIQLVMGVFLGACTVLYCTVVYCTVVYCTALELYCMYVRMYV